MKEILDKLKTKSIIKEIEKYISKEIPLALKKFLQSSPYSTQVMNKYEILYLHFVIIYNYFILNKKNEELKKYLKNICNKDFIEFKLLTGKQEDYLTFLLKKYATTLQNQSYEQLFTKLREIKSIEFVLLGIIHYLNITDVEQVNYAITKLTDFCFEYGSQAAFNKLTKSQFSYDDFKTHIIILGMGKLGGNELNFSSDIDIIIFYDDDFFSHNDLQVLNLFIRHLLNILRQNSEKGFLYRVDLRLRPEGSSGPLIMGINQAIEYYQNRAKIWEYQAMIKNRLVWGGEKKYNTFSNAISQIIYSNIPEEKLLTQIKEIKAKIESKIKSNSNKINIKLSPGGIRDIEFIVQFLQLLHGKKYIEIRNTGSLEALRSLHTFKIITNDEYTTLSKNYIFFRIIENLLQFSDNIPVQSIPIQDNEMEKTLLAPVTLQYFTKSKQVIPKIKNAMQRVREIFTMLFDETIHFINLKNDIIELNKNNSNILKQNLIDDHFDRMDSEYFIKFSKENIFQHLQMIARLNEKNLIELAVNNTDECEWELSIVAFDYYYEFAKIAGLLSAYYLTILNAESFTYSNSKIKEHSITNSFYRRHRKRIYKSNTNSLNLLKRRKIVCLIKIKLLSPKHKPDWREYKRELNNLLMLLEKKQNTKAEEILNSKLFIKYTQISKKNLSTAIHPVNIKIDNDSSNTYTILHIKTTDTFAFLFTFTNLLSFKNYYIFKIEVYTKDNKVQNRFFVTSGEGAKITDKKKIEELEILAMLIIQYSSLLYKTPNPNSALHYFYELVSRIIESDQKNELPIIGQPDVLEKLSTLFGISDFIWEDLFRINYKSLLPFLNDKSLNKKTTKDELLNLFHKTYQKELSDYKIFIKALNDFKDKQMFRIDLRQIQNKIDFFEFANELSDLAEVIVELSLKQIEEYLKNEKLQNIPPWAIFGLGKLGGRELGYASDIELIFVYDYDNSEEKGVISAYFEKFMQLFLKSIITKREGIFEIDMKLRPYGKKGSLAVSLDTFSHYFSQNGEAYFFERQALIKLRFITSNKQGEYLKQKVTQYRDNFVYSEVPPDYKFVRNMREKQIAHYTNEKKINTKYSRGALVDIEYLTQLLQIKHGHKYISIRKQSTLDALDALHKEKIIDDTAYQELKDIYIFYRNLINALRMEKGNAKDLTIYDDDSLEFDYLVQRIYFTQIIEKADKNLLINKLHYSLKRAKFYFDLFTKE